LDCLLVDGSLTARFKVRGASVAAYRCL